MFVGGTGRFPRIMVPFFFLYLLTLVVLVVPLVDGRWWEDFLGLRLNVKILKNYPCFVVWSMVVVLWPPAAWRARLYELSSIAHGTT